MKIVCCMLFVNRRKAPCSEGTLMQRTHKVAGFCFETLALSHPHTHTRTQTAHAQKHGWQHHALFSKETLLKKSFWKAFLKDESMLLLIYPHIDLSTSQINCTCSRSSGCSSRYRIVGSCSTRFCGVSPSTDDPETRWTPNWVICAGIISKNHSSFSTRFLEMRLGGCDERSSIRSQLYIMYVSRSVKTQFALLF